MPKLKINLFGELWSLSKLELSEVEFVCIKQRSIEMGLPLTEALLDISFYETNLFSGRFKRKTLDGLLNSYKNQIEIWFAGKKILKMKMVDLNSELLLFPLYKTCEDKFIESEFEQGIYIEQREIGLVASYEKLVDYFEINQLEFLISKVEMKNVFVEILTGIKYNNAKLKIKNSDTLITQQSCYKL